MNQARPGRVRDAILLSLIFLGALAVRLPGVHRGLPYIHEFDEPFVMNPLMQMFLFHTLNPQFFSYPSLYYYLQLPVVLLHYAYLHVLGAIPSPDDIRFFYPYMPSGYGWYINYPSFYLWARMLTVLFGTATVYLTYRIGRAAFGSTVGLLAAAVLAFAPGAVYYSDAVRVDIPMVFFVTAAMLAGLAVLQRGRLRDYVLAGILAGLAISTKQTAVWVLVPLGVAHVLTPGRKRLLDLRLATLGASVVVAFFSGTPYALIQPGVVFPWFAREANAYGGLPSLESILHGLPHNLAYFAQPTHGGEYYTIPHAGLGLLPSIAAAWGLVAGFLWMPRLQLYLASFALPMLIFVSGFSVFYPRNLIAILPFAALWAAAGVVWLWRLFEAHRLGRGSAWRLALGAIGVMLVVLGLLLGPVRQSVTLVGMLARQQDTRAEAVEWVLRHAPRGSGVAFEIELAWFLPAFDHVPIRVEFTGRDTPLSWYAKERIAFAVVGERNPARMLPGAAVFLRPSYRLTSREEESYADPNNSPVIDPAIFIVLTGTP